VVAEIAQMRAEIERQKARAPREKRRLDADGEQPALAKQRAAEESARGEASRTLERGRAEAASLKALVEAYRVGGEGAREVLALQNLLPMLAHVAGAHHQLNIGKMSFLPSEKSPGADLARKAIGANEQIEAATGVDLLGMAKKHGG
jgi:flotillin